MSLEVRPLSNTSPNPGLLNIPAALVSVMSAVQVHNIPLNSVTSSRSQSSKVPAGIYGFRNPTLQFNEPIV